MTPEQIVNNSEPVDPETIRHFIPEIDELSLQKIQVMWLLKNTRQAYEDMDVFENAVLILNDIIPEIDRMNGTLPEQIWKTILVIKKLVPHVELSDEVLNYIKYIFKDNGYLFYPPGLGLDNPLLMEIKSMSINGPFPLPETVIGIQAYKYTTLMEYLKSHAS